MALLSFCARLVSFDEEKVNTDYISWKVRNGRQLMKLEVTAIIIIMIIKKLF